MRVTGAVLGALVAAMLIYGCGGGDPEPLPKTAFLKQGNEICARAEKTRAEDSKALAENEGGSGDEELESFVSDAVAPSVGDMTSELGDLGAPKGEEKQVEKIIAEYEAGLEKLEAEPKLMLEGDPFAAANKMAGEYGLTECVI